MEERREQFECSFCGQNSTSSKTPKRTKKPVPSAMIESASIRQHPEINNQNAPRKIVHRSGADRRHVPRASAQRARATPWLADRRGNRIKG